MPREAAWLGHDLEPLFEVWFTADTGEFRRYLWPHGSVLSVGYVRRACLRLVRAHGPGAAPNVRLAP